MGDPSPTWPYMAEKPDVVVGESEIAVIGSLKVQHEEGDDDGSLYLDSEYGNLRLGGDGQDGDLFVEDPEGNRTIVLNGKHGNAHLGGGDSAGDLLVEDGDGNQVIELNGGDGNARLGGEGSDGDVLLYDHNGDTRVHLDPGRGPVDHDLVRAYVDGAAGEATFGGEDAPGAVRLRSTHGFETATLSSGKLALGGGGEESSVQVDNGAGLTTFTLDGQYGRAKVGGAGGSGDLVINESVEPEPVDPNPPEEQEPTVFSVVLTADGDVQPQSNRVTVTGDLVLDVRNRGEPTAVDLSQRGPTTDLVTLPPAAVTVDDSQRIRLEVDHPPVATAGELTISDENGGSARVLLDVVRDPPDVVLPPLEPPEPVPRVHLDGDGSGPAGDGVRVHADADGTLTLGGDGEDGSVVLQNGDGDAVAEVTVDDGQVVLRDGVDGPTMAWDPGSGDLAVSDGDGNETLSFDGASGDLEVAGSVTENAGGS